MSATDSDAAGPGPATGEVHAYCREVEAYLCRRNDGHLIRVVGPAFDLVRDWAVQGIPITIVREAIDRTVERAEKQQRRRRPIRIEFCAAEVLDGYDRWRRAVGVAHTAAGGTTGSAAKRGTLQAHVDRVAVQLAAALGSDRAPVALQPSVTAALTALDAVRAGSATARGGARDAVITALADLDRTLIDAAVRVLPRERLDALTAEAEGELAPFRGRLQPAQWDAAVVAARARLVRAAVGLPRVSFD